MGEKESELIKELALPLKVLAERVGVPYTSLRNWSAGRPIPAEGREALVSFARSHARELERMADELEAS